MDLRVWTVAVLGISTQALSTLALPTLALPALAAPAPGTSVATRDSRLRSGCDSDSAVRASVPAGAPLAIRSMMSGETVPCYRVAVTVDGKTLEGYLDATAIGGAEDFDRARRQAESLDWNQVMGAFRASSVPSAAGAGARPASGNISGGIAAQAASLIEASQPQKALALLEPELKKGRDPNLLAMAGAAAWRSDDTARALEYWKASLELRPDPKLQALYARLQTETQNDHAGAKLVGMRVQLRYDLGSIPVESARQILGTLDQEYARITAELGCPGEERVVAVAQSREDYLKATQAAEWSGGEYDGRIHVPVTGNGGENLHRALAHEMVHACLTMLGRWPAWVQEGVAQKLSGDTLSPAARKSVTEALQAEKIPGLTKLGKSWSGADAASARAAYAESLAAIDLYYENSGGLGLRNLLRNPERLPDIAADLDKKLRQ